MKRRLWVTLICGFVLCFALASCKGEFNAEAKANFLGTWEAESIESEDPTIATSAEDFAAMKALGITITLALADDDTYTLDLAGDLITGTWNASSETSCTLELEGAPTEAMLEESKLKLIQTDGSSMTFVKTSDDTASSSSTSAEESSNNEAESIPVNKVIADDEICTIEVIDASVDFAGDPGYNLKITNHTDKAIYVDSEYSSFSVDGKMSNLLIMETVKAGSYLEVFAFFDGDEIGSDPAALVNVDGVIEVLDDDTWELIASYPFVL